MNRTFYHYTSPQGIFGILKENALWFTDCQYLNDMTEFLYLREPLKEAYSKIISERGEKKDDIDNFIDSFFDSPYETTDWNWNRGKKGFRKLSKIPSFRYYVLCVSKNPDTANMWNYYVKDGAYRGYNLGLDGEMIKIWFKAFSKTNNKVQLVENEVIYDRRHQVDIIYKKLKELIDEFDKRIDLLDEDGYDAPAIDAFQGDLLEYIDEQKLFFKNPAFKSEEEYRFVLKVHNDFNEDIDENNNSLSVKYRVGTSGIITPYIEWHFDVKNKSDLLKQITLSPMMEPELAKESFKRFLADGVYRNIRIEQSSIKLRF